MNRCRWIRILAILPLFAEKYAPGGSPGESWNIVEQPELRQQLEAVPALKTEYEGSRTNSILLNGIDLQWLIRWNGLPGTVAFGVIEGAGMADAEKIVWAKEPDTTVMAVVPTVSGDGHIAFVQLDLPHRLDHPKAITTWQPSEFC